MADNPVRITGPNGKPYIWNPDTRNAELFEKLGESSGFQTMEDAIAADKASGAGSYVEENYTNSKAILPKLMLFGMIAGPLIADYAPLLWGGAGPGGGAATAPGAFGAAPTASFGPTAVGTGALGGTAPAATFGPAAATGGFGAAPTATFAGSSVAGPLVAGGGTAGGGAMTGGRYASAFRLGQSLLGYAQGAGQGRQAEANLNLGQDTLRQRQAESERQAALDKAKLETDQRTVGQDLESQARRQAAWGQFMQRPAFHVNRPDYITDTPVAPRSQAQMEMGDQAYRAAMDRLVTGSDKKFPELPNIPTPPITAPPKESLTDRLIRLGGLGLGMYGSYGYQPPTTRT